MHLEQRMHNNLSMRGQVSTVSSVFLSVFIALLGYNIMKVLGNIVFTTHICFEYNAIKHVVTGHK
jgi:hypothetical protein